MPDLVLGALVLKLGLSRELLLLDPEAFEADLGRERRRKVRRHVRDGNAIVGPAGSQATAKKRRQGKQLPAEPSAARSHLLGPETQGTTDERSSSRVLLKTGSAGAPSP